MSRPACYSNSSTTLTAVQTMFLIKRKEESNILKMIIEFLTVGIV